MKMGTRSLLFGAHQFLIHPALVLAGWFKIYGFRAVEYKAHPDSDTIRVRITSPMLWAAAFFHDLGYFGLSDMDGHEGQMHPILSGMMFGVFCDIIGVSNRHSWSWFVETHSRHTWNWYREFSVPELEMSPLAHADKMATVLFPSWAYIAMVRATGEIREYQSTKRHSSDGGYLSYDSSRHTFREDVEWLNNVKTGFRKWIRENPYRGPRERDSQTD